MLKKRTTPLGTAAVRNFDEFCALLNVIMTTAPVFATESKWNLEPAGLVGFPINALLNWPMATDAGTPAAENPRKELRVGEIGVCGSGGGAAAAISDSFTQTPSTLA